MSAPRTKPLAIHAFATESRRAAAGDEEAARRYEALATLTDDPETRRERLAQAEDSRASAREWLDAISARLRGGVRR